MYIANQVDEAAMGAGGRAQYTDFLQVQSEVADLAGVDLAAAQRFVQCRLPLMQIILCE
jgi:hypothetical protein